MRTIFAICLACLHTYAARAETQAGIEWSGDRPLTWEDFRGSVPRRADSVRVAATHTSLSWSYEYEIQRSPTDCNFRILRLESAAAFHPDGSWVRSGHRTPSVLRHEQGHFDITEIYRQRFDESTAEFVGDPRPCRSGNERRLVRNVEREIDRLIGSIYDGVWREHLEEQEAYDSETRHGIDTSAQSKWIQRIAAALLTGAR